MVVEAGSLVQEEKDEEEGGGDWKIEAGGDIVEENHDRGRKDERGEMRNNGLKGGDDEEGDVVASIDGRKESEEVGQRHEPGVRGQEELAGGEDEGGSQSALDSGVDAAEAEEHEEEEGRLVADNLTAVAVEAAEPLLHLVHGGVVVVGRLGRQGEAEGTLLVVGGKYLLERVRISHPCREGSDGAEMLEVEGEKEQISSDIGQHCEGTLQNSLSFHCFPHCSNM